MKEAEKKFNPPFGAKHHTIAADDRLFTTLLTRLREICKGVGKCSTMPNNSPAHTVTATQD